MALKLGIISRARIDEMILRAAKLTDRLEVVAVASRGEMSMVDKMPGTKVYHLEVHICTKQPGAVVTKLKPLIIATVQPSA